jgi:tetratricopeptide (TPR) repeat protein
MFAHAEAIRLHKKALSIVCQLPETRDRDRQELEILQALAAPLNARHGYSSPELQQALERSVVLAEALGRKDSTLTSLAALWTSRFVQGRIADGYETGTRALALVDPESEPSGPAHFAVGGSALSLGRPAEAVRHLEVAARLASGALSLSIGTRPDVHSLAFSAHAHWLLGHDEEALSNCHRAIELARAIEHPYSLAVALAYGSITHQMRDDLPGLRDAVAELSGLDLARRGISNLRSAGSLTRMPYWLSLLADLSAGSGRPDAARATLDAALTAAHAHADMWWLPEVMRMRAAHDDAESGLSRLRSAAQLATTQGSVALLRRCERDLTARGPGAASPGVLPVA